MPNNKCVKMPKVNIFKKANSAPALNEWDYVYRETLGLKKEHAHHKKQKVLIHTIRHKESEFYLRNAESVLKSWDVVSASLITFGSRDRAQWADVGLLLAVPPQNIIGTYPCDISFPNNIGNEPNTPRKPMELMSRYFYTYQAGGWGYDTFSVLISPNDKLMASGHSLHGHNEVVSVCKPHINTYEGRPPTQPIQVCGIYIHPNNSIITDEIISITSKLKAMNPDLPVFKYGGL
ncbi:hypothetical protein NUF46_003785 [Yersinia enterocolitica]|nr:hypothetical protein [Yersinia enterocolitica]